MLTPEEYKKKLEAMKNGLSQPAANPAPLPLPSTPAPVNMGLLPSESEYTNTDTGAVQDTDTRRKESSQSLQASNTEASSGMQSASNDKALSSDNVEQIKEDNALIDPAEAYCDDCGKDISECDCIPTEDESEASILASLGITQTQIDKHKASNDNGKDLDAIINNSAIEENALSAAEIVAREYATTEDELIIFRNIFNQTHEKVKDLFPDQLEQKILHLDRAIKGIQAMQQACKRLASDKLEKESAKEKAERREREKSYKVPRRRTSEEVDAHGAKKEIKGGKTSRDKLIANLMLAGISREKAEAMADGN